MENFCKWVINDLNEVDLFWNVVMLSTTRGGWLFIMVLYYWFFKRRKN